MGLLDEELLRPLVPVLADLRPRGGAEQGDGEAQPLPGQCLLIRICLRIHIHIHIDIHAMNVHIYVYTYIYVYVRMQTYVPSLDFGILVVLRLRATGACFFSSRILGCMPGMMLARVTG